MPGDGAARIVDIGADELRREPRCGGQLPRLLDRRRREIEPGDDRALTGEGQRVEPEMALQMDHPLAGDIAKLAALDRMQRLPLPEKSLDRVEAGAVAAVDRHPLVPVAPVGVKESADVAHRG